VAETHEVSRREFQSECIGLEKAYFLVTVSTVFV